MLNSLFKVLLSVIYFSTNLPSGLCLENVTVSTKYGQLEGTLMSTVNGKDIFAFLAVPYAKPPVGELRFQRTQRVEKWAGVYNATTAGPICVQNHIFTSQVQGSEDCLYLNVYTPELPTDNSSVEKAVMVFIHGGGFVQGTGRSDNYSPAKLLDYDVVLVTFNYRLGPFGFLSTEDDNAPGNYGIWDQVEVLRWVQHNIKVFGGDPKRVTVFGESAGASSVGVLYVSNAANGLFHRAIAQSGSSMCVAGPLSPKQDAVTLAEVASCPTNSSTEIVDCLRNLTAVDLLNLFDNLKPAAQRSYRPIVEGQDVTGRRILENSTTALIKQGNFQKVPLMIGVNSNEGESLFYRFVTSTSPIYSTNSKTRLTFVTATVKRFVPLASEQPAVLQEAMSIYFGNFVNMTNAEILDTLIKVVGDSIVVACTNRTAVEVARNKGTSYLYNFDHTGGPSIMAISQLRIPSGGVPHADELPYLFDIPIFSLGDTTGEHKVIQDRMLSLWTNFAKTGSPSMDESWWNLRPELGDYQYYRFSTNSMDNQAFVRNQTFYDSLGDQEEEEFQTVYSN